MSKYKEIVQVMMDENQELFNNFKEIHDEYALDPGKWQKIFNDYGREVQDQMRIYERRLLTKMSTGKYGQFSTQVSDKFWSEVRKIFPKIDFIGVKP
jgi:hypothetical protein